MLEKSLMLRSMDDVKKFVDIANTKSYDIELMSGKYIINAKSIMDVFSLDLTKPVTMVAHCDSVAELARQVAPFALEAQK